MLLDTDLNKYRCQIESMRSGDQNEYPHLNKQVYLDHAANAIYPASLIRAYERRLTSSDNWSLFSNPHSHSQSAAYTTTLVDSVREKILSSLFESSSKDYDLVFVSNATAGLKLLGECFKPDCLAYFLDNHTSVIGMREIIEPNSHVLCVSEGLDGDLQFKVVKHSNQR